MSINLNFHICLNAAKEWKNSNIARTKTAKKKKKKSSLLGQTHICPYFKRATYPNHKDIEIQQRPNQSKYSKTQKKIENKNESPRSGEVVRRRMEVRRDSAAANGGPMRQCGGKCQSGEDGLEAHELKSDMRFQGNVKQVLIICLLRCYQVHQDVLILQ